MIVDCFPFFNELEVLEIRLAELNEVVDGFVLVESGQTFSGKPKEYVFEANKERFKDYPVFSVRIPSFPAEMTSPWDREHASRNMLGQALQALQLEPSDIVLISDVDEIPRAEVVRECLQRMGELEPGGCFVFDMSFYHYYVNCKAEPDCWGTRMARYGDVSTMQEFRFREGTVVPNGGWHFSYLGGIDRIREKIAAYSHTEIDIPRYTDPAYLQECLAEAKDNLGRGVRFHYVPIDGSYPRYLLQHQEALSHLIEQRSGYPTLEELYLGALGSPPPIPEQLRFLYRLASTVKRVTEFGSGAGETACSFLYARPENFVSYDSSRHAAIYTIEEAARRNGIGFQFVQQGLPPAGIERTDLLLIHTAEVGSRLGEALLHADAARRYLVLADIKSPALAGGTGENSWRTIARFARAKPHWHLLHPPGDESELVVFTRV